MWKDFGLFFIRVGIGLIFLVHGYPKIIGGPEKWLWLGNQMANLGIYAIPVFWGFLAACAEFFGGIALVFGLGTRIAAFFMAFVMLVAVFMHLAQGDGFGIYSQPLSLFVIFIGLFLAGGGRFSLEALLR